MHLRSSLLILLILMGSCVPKREVKSAQMASTAGDWDEAYRLYTQLLEQYPDDTKFRINQERARNNAALDHLRKANRYFERDQLAEAAFEVNLTLGFDPDNQSAQNLVMLIKEAKEAELEEQAAAERARNEEPISSLPKLTPSTWAPLNLTFTNQSAKDIYISLGKAYGINIVVDSELREKKVTIDLKNLSFLKALDTLMILNRHFFKIVDDNTIIIMEDSKKNRDRYDSQIIQTFYLSNVTPKDLKPHLRQLSTIKEFAENEKLNAITIKGTAEEIALAHKIIADNDKAQPEVVVELEILEVNKNTMRRVGILPVDTSGNAQFRAGVFADPVGRSDSDRQSSGIRGIFPSLEDSDFLTIVPALAIDFLKEKGGSKQVANPQLRVTSGEAGMVSIGQSIPIAQTSFTNAQISGSASGANSFGDSALTTFDYNDVGIKIQVTPRVHYNNEITLELELQISSVVSGGPQPVLGKREVKTIIRLRNGETNVLAGLLNNDERKSLLGIAGLSEIPVLGKLFSNDEKVISQTDIILTTRPVIIRGPNISRKDKAPYELSTLRLSSLYGEEALKGQKPVKTPKRTDNAIQLEDDNGYEEAYEEEPAYEEDGENYEDEEYPYEEEDTGPAPAMLAFTPAATEVRRDDVIEYQMFITNVEGMHRGEIVIDFNPEVLQASLVELGDFFGSANNRPLMTPAWDNSRGRLTMIFTNRHGAEPFSGSGILANLRFLAKGPGSGELEFSRLNLTDKDKTALPAEGLVGRYEVTP